MSAAAVGANPFGAYLRGRRERLDPAALGFSLSRRRTPGLRREEVAQRAGVSATWYTWLEQGRGGAPSADVLDRLSRALMLTEVEREHLYLIGLGRPPEIRYREVEGVTPRLQRVLDALQLSPALVKTATWDIVAWNRAATAVLADYGALEAHQRNVLRMMFLEPRVRERQLDWESVARYVVASFRAETTRVGATEAVKALVEDLRRASPDFERLWRDNDVESHGDGVKTMRDPTGELLSMEYSAFAIEGRPDLALVIYNPATPADAERIRALIEASERAI
jgi:transcriptional regulator with XRE-family HTH domain